jgi:hypothetical protein
MLKKSLFAVAAVALLAVVAQAGEIKIHDWPTSYIPQELTDIPVVMDVGYWVSIKDQDTLQIELDQKSIHTYEGCTDMVVECNFNISLSCSISSTGAVPGDYGCSVTPSDIDAGTATATVCASLTNANLSATAGGTQNVHVATVTIKVVPR